MNNFNNKKINENKGSFFSKIIRFIILFMIFFSGYHYINYNKFLSKPIILEDKFIEIKYGDNFSNLGNKINVLDNAYYKYYIKNNKPDFELQAGNYMISSGSTIDNLIESLNKPINNEISITILEGRNIYDIDEVLNKKGLIDAGEYINYVTDSEKINALKEFFPFLGNIKTLEGFLYPDTYNVSISPFKINNFVIKQLETFETKVYEKILKNLDNETITDLVNLASIVEKEEKNNDEKAIVAGILKKRLNSGWMIGADATVCYPYKLTSNDCKMSVTRYLYEKNSYNTRQIVGLPKTPICNPSFSTINATLNDKETPYWFYLHNITTGKIYYAKTNAEHEQNKAKYMR
ncbi:MAG: endolytic transglycosylase MltG [Candidatus Gracilibacteria bacterium]|nr:endolytic transglycosylase MltG [Candidatus Gracilibacteria bacterium]